MKNDYLFDGTGEDAEIEQLEDLLRGYRYVETDPPELPAMNIVPVRASWRSRYGWIFALGTATAALMLTVFYVGALRAPQQRTEKQVSVTTTTENLNIPVNATPTTPDISPAVKSDEVATVVQKAVHTNRRPRAARILTQTIARRQPTKAGSEKITKEELYAYNQVKLALFITGSKLRTVSDVIEKIENKQDGSSNKSR